MAQKRSRIWWALVVDGPHKQLGSPGGGPPCPRTLASFGVDVGAPLVLVLRPEGAKPGDMVEAHEYKVASLVRGGAKGTMSDPLPIRWVRRLSDRAYVPRAEPGVASTPPCDYPGMPGR